MMTQSTIICQRRASFASLLDAVASAATGCCGLRLGTANERDQLVERPLPDEIDSRGDSTYAPTRAPCNDATGHVSACLNVRYAESTDGGATWGSSIQVTDMPTNPNYEQFGGRLVPFFGDYITVAAVGDTVGAVWTDQRDTVGAADPSGDDDGAD